MTAIWFGLAAACLVGAGVLLNMDRLRRVRTGRVRQSWAKSHGYSFKAMDPTLPQQWRRATLAKQGYLAAVDIATGTRRGVRFTLFDLEDSATIVAVQRRIGSDVDIDLRLKTTAPPKDPDLELLGSMGDHVVFATDVDIARRVADQRMAALAEILPANLQVLWSENTWTLGSLPVTATTRDWDQAIDGVIRFSGLLHVLPPPGETLREPRPARPARRTPVAESGGDDEEAAWENEQRLETSPRGLRAEDFSSEYEEPRVYVNDDDDYAAEGQAAEGETAERPGGPFHPGFRPYQGPAGQ